jgi:hypothetical protein
LIGINEKVQDGNLLYESIILFLLLLQLNSLKDLVADGTEYRRLLRAWHQLHGILAEANVLDETGEIVEVIHACQAHKCIRFGSCPSEVSGCATVPKHTYDGIYPIYHLDKV